MRDSRVSKNVAIDSLIAIKLNKGMILFLLLTRRKETQSLFQMLENPIDKEDNNLYPLLSLL